MTKGVEILGLEQTYKALNALPFQLRSRLTINALKRAAKPMKDEAQQNAPVRKGIIRKSISIVQNTNAAEPEVWVAPKRTKRADPWYAIFQEFGTSGFGKRRSSVTWDSGLARTAKTTGQRVYQLKSGRRAGAYKMITGYHKKGVGLPAVHFMENAFDKKSKQALADVKPELAKVMTEFLRKNAPNRLKYYGS